jgi:hypothetical protein
MRARTFVFTHSRGVATHAYRVRTVSAISGPARATGSGVSMHVYEIAVRGSVGPRVRDALEGFDVVAIGNGRTLFRGAVADSAGLRATLDMISSLGLEIATLRAIDDEDVAEAW